MCRAGVGSTATTAPRTTITIWPSAKGFRMPRRRSAKHFHSPGRRRAFKRSLWSLMPAWWRARHPFSYPENEYHHAR